MISTILVSVLIIALGVVLVKYGLSCILFGGATLLALFSKKD